MTNEIKKEKIKVLDHGYIKFIESWGRGEAGVDEAGIIEAARQSTQGSFRGWETDEKLLAFLFNGEPQHATPFEFAGLVIEVQAPIFVFREWHRHRTQSYNEMSARYAPLPDLNYTPTFERLFDIDSKNRQATAQEDSKELTEDYARDWLNVLENYIYPKLEQFYQDGLKNGIPKELARVAIPVGRYSRMRVALNLRNALAFLTLRYHPKAQKEIQAFATVFGDQILRFAFPKTYSLFEKKRL